MMGKYLTLFLSGVFLAAGTSLLWGGEHPAASQDRETTSSEFSVEERFNSSAYAAINNVKQEILALLEENKMLEAEYKALYKESLTAQEMAAQYKKEIAVLENSIGIDDAGRWQDEINASQQNMNSLKDNVLIQKSKNAALADELMNFYELEKLHDLKLADLQYEKRALEIDLQLKKAQHEKMRQAAGQERDALQKKLEESLKEERESAGRLEEAANRPSVSLEEIQQKRLENKVIEGEIAQLERKIKLKKKENDILKDKRLLTARSVENSVWEKEQTKADMRSRVQTLEADLGQLQNQVNLSLSEQGANRTLIEDIIAIDKENQELRNKIAELETQMETRSQPWTKY